MEWIISNGDIVQVVVSYESINIIRLMNTFHYRAVDFPPAGLVGDQVLQNLLERHFAPAGVIPNWADLWSSATAPEYRITNITAQKIFPTRIRPVGIAQNFPGVRTGSPLPAVATWSITKRALQATRHGIGGLRMSGLPDTDEENGVTTVAVRPVLDTVAAFAAARLTNTDTDPEGWDPLILNRASPALSLVVSNAIPQFTIRSQRTRIAFRGL